MKKQNENISVDFTSISSVITYIFVLFTSFAFSQSVGIFGSTNLGINNTGAKGNVKSVFDISSPDKGLLIPGITTASRDTFTNIPTSLLIFNTTTNQYEYYNGSVWNTIAIGTNWSLTGNTSTVDGTHFIGTTDDIPFNIRVNNNKAGRIERVNANTFWGYQAGSNNSTGLNNTANGYQALYSNTTGFSNVAIGIQALYRNTARSNLVAIGDSTLYNNEVGAVNPWDGTNNVAVGSKALYGNTTGNYNVAIGSNALTANTTGGSNMAAGAWALQKNTTGTQNTAIGMSALDANTTGSLNTAVGEHSLLLNISGSYNSALGRDALKNTTASNNTAIGWSAGWVNTTGTNNTFVGYAADVTASGFTNATAIGYNAKVGASNALALGGTGADAVNVGIGITSPANKLDVDGGITINQAGTVDNASPALTLDMADDFLYDGEYLSHYGLGWHPYNDGSGFGSNAYLSGYWGMDFFTGGTERLRINGNGNVGIGTNGPTAKLEVAAGGSFKARLNRTDAGASLKSEFVFAKQGTDKFSIGIDMGEAGAQEFYIYDNVASATRLHINNIGNVGIGTTSPKAKLETFISPDIAMTSSIFGGWGKGIFNGMLSGVAIEHVYPGIHFNGYHDGTNFISIGPGYGGQIQVEPTGGNMYINMFSNAAAAGDVVTATMQIVGYVIKVKDGWLVCENLDGTIEKISKLRPAVKAREVILD